jgi:hypothetical protein
MSRDRARPRARDGDDDDEVVARHVRLVCKYIARQGAAFEETAIARHARADGFAFLNDVGDDARDGGARDGGARARHREMYVRERDAAIETYERARRAAEEKERTREGEGERDRDDGYADDDARDGEALASVMRAREIAERLFAGAPMEREPGTIVIDFERGVAETRGGDAVEAATTTGKATAPATATVELGEEDELVDDDFKALVNEFVVDDEDENEDEDAPGARVTEAEANANAETTATDAEPPEKEDDSGHVDGVEDGSNEEEPEMDLTMMFPSSKRRPVGDLGGFEQVMRVKKKRGPRKPKPKYEPTPSLLDDDLVALPVAPLVDDDDHDNDEEDDDVAETDVEDSPQVTEVPLEFLFPSSKPKRALPEKKKNDDEDDDVTQREPVLAVEVTEVIAHTEDVADTDADEGEVMQQTPIKESEANPWDSITRAAVECNDAVVRESPPEATVFALPGRAVKLTEPEPESDGEETEVEEAEQTEEEEEREDEVFMLPGKPVRIREVVTRDEPASDSTEREDAEPMFCLPGKPVKPREEKNPSGSDVSSSLTVKGKDSVDKTNSICNVESPAGGTRQKPKPPKVVAETLLARRVLQLIKSTLNVADLTKGQFKIILRKSMHKITTTVPKKFDQNTEEGTTSFLSDSRKQKINRLLDEYVKRVKLRAASKNSTPTTPSPFEEAKKVASKVA